jgi:hypothetical protein
VPLGTSSNKGTANAQITFPSSSFPSNGTTDYAGFYTVYFNQTASLAQNKFTINILNSITYHRGQTAAIVAVDYQPN